MANESPTIGLHLTPETEGSKPFKDWRTEMSGDDATSNLMIIDEAFSEVMENQTDISDAIDNINTELSSYIDNNGGTYYGGCATSGDIVEKIVDLPGFVRRVGVIVGVRFTRNNTAANPTLNVNNTGAASIRFGGFLIEPGMLPAESRAMFQWDGSSWRLLSPPDLGVYHGVCPTPSGTATKQVELYGMTEYPSVRTGTIVGVLFNNDDTSANQQLRFANHPAAPIRYNGTPPALGMIQANVPALFQWDGEYWQLLNPVDTTTLPAAKAYADEKDAELIPLTQRGTANGVATLDASAEIPSGQVPEYFVICTTPAATATKVITIGNLDIATLKPGTTIAFYLSSGNTNAAPALDVNGQGAKMMYSTLTGTNITAAEFSAATTYVAVWDGTNWGIVNTRQTITPAQIGAATMTRYTATIPVLAESTSYTSVTVSGILATDTPIIDTTGTTDLQRENWAKITRIVTAANAIRVYRSGATSGTIPIQLIVIR